MPFEARKLPAMIDLNGEIVAGPFCIHCGYPFSMHGDHLACRVTPNLVLAPSCRCHTIKLVLVTRGRKKQTRMRIVRV